MRLHYYAPAVSQSYCVGVHNGHGFGSLFARLFSKVAVKTAARAAVKVAKVAGRKALKVVTTKGADFARKTAENLIKEGARAGTELAIQKINSLTESALKTRLPASVVHTISDVVREGTRTVGSKVANSATDKALTLIDKGVTRAEQVAGIKRKATTVHKRKATVKKKKATGKKTAANRKHLQNLIESV